MIQLNVRGLLNASSYYLAVSFLILILTTHCHSQTIDRNFIHKNKAKFTATQINIVLKAISLHDSAKYAKSRELLTSALDENQAKPIIYTLIAHCFLKEDRLALAIVNFQMAHRAIDSAKRNNYPVYLSENLANALVRSGEFAKASGYFIESTEQSKATRRLQLYFSVAFCFEKANDPWMAYCSYLILLMLDPGASDIWEKAEQLKNNHKFTSPQIVNVFKNIPDSLCSIFTKSILQHGDPNKWIKPGYSRAYIDSFADSYMKMHTLLKEKYPKSAEDYLYFSGHNMARLGFVRNHMFHDYLDNRRQIGLLEDEHNHHGNEKRQEHIKVRDSARIADTQRIRAEQVLNESLTFYSHWELNMSTSESKSFIKRSYLNISDNYFCKGDFPNTIDYFMKGFLTHDSTTNEAFLRRSTDFKYLRNLLYRLFDSVSFDLETGKVLPNWDNSDFEGPFVLNCDTCIIDTIRRYLPSEIHPYGIVSASEDHANQGFDDLSNIDKENRGKMTPEEASEENARKELETITDLIRKSNFERPLKYILDDLESYVSFIGYYQDAHEKGDTIDKARMLDWLMRDAEDISKFKSLTKQIEDRINLQADATFGQNLLDALYTIQQILKLPQFEIYPRLARLLSSEQIFMDGNTARPGKFYAELKHHVWILLALDPYDQLVIDQSIRINKLPN